MIVCSASDHPAVLVDDEDVEKYIRNRLKARESSMRQTKLCVVHGCRRPAQYYTGHVIASTVEGILAGWCGQHISEDGEPFLTMDDYGCVGFWTPDMGAEERPLGG